MENEENKLKNSSKILLKNHFLHRSTKTNNLTLLHFNFCTAPHYNPEFRDFSSNQKPKKGEIRGWKTSGAGGRVQGRNNSTPFPSRCLWVEKEYLKKPLTRKTSFSRPFPPTLDLPFPSSRGKKKVFMGWGGLEKVLGGGKEFMRVNCVSPTFPFRMFIGAWFCDPPFDRSLFGLSTTDSLPPSSQQINNP